MRPALANHSISSIPHCLTLTLALALALTLTLTLTLTVTLTLTLTFAGLVPEDGCESDEAPPADGH